MAMPEIMNILQQGLSGQYNPVGLGFNPPAGLGPNPVRQLPTPDPTQVGYFPSGGSFGAGSSMSALLPLLQLIAPFIQGNVGVTPFTPAGAGQGPQGSPGGLLQAIVQSLISGQSGATGSPMTPSASPMSAAGSAGAPAGAPAPNPMQTIMAMLGGGGGGMDFSGGGVGTSGVSGPDIGTAGPGVPGPDVGTAGPGVEPGGGPSAAGSWVV